MQVCSACSLEYCPLPLTELPKETELLQWTDSAEVRGAEVHLICFSFTETELECCPHNQVFSYTVCSTSLGDLSELVVTMRIKWEKNHGGSSVTMCVYQKVVMGEMSQRASQTSRSCHNTCMKKERCWRHWNLQELLVRWQPTLLAGSTVLAQSQDFFRWDTKLGYLCGHWRAGLQNCFCKVRNDVVLIILQLRVTLLHLPEPLCNIFWRRLPSLLLPQNWSLPQLEWCSVGCCI